MKRKFITIIIYMSILLIIASCSSQKEEEPTKKDSSSNIVEEEAIPAGGNKKEDTAILPYEYLQKGDQGEAVRLVQEDLRKIGYDIKTTETFDDQTTWALTDLQLQFEFLYPTGFYDDDTKEIIIDIINGEEKITIGKHLTMPSGKKQNQVLQTVENPYEVLSLVNKSNALSDTYIPEDLTTPNVRFPFTEDLPKKQLRKVAADALEELFKEADIVGLDLFAQSGYRSFARQDTIFASNVKAHGDEAANNFSARPGESEHQSGLTMDITSPNINYELTIEFGETEEGQWVKEHASDFGFIIRYPEGKEDITKYQYEPWHLRYVGKRAAKEIMDNKLTLEEYLDNK